MVNCNNYVSYVKKKRSILIATILILILNFITATLLETILWRSHAFTCLDIKQKTSYSPSNWKMGYLKPINSSNYFLIRRKFVVVGKKQLHTTKPIWFKNKHLKLCYTVLLYPC